MGFIVKSRGNRARYLAAFEVTSCAFTEIPKEAKQFPTLEEALKVKQALGVDVQDLLEVVPVIPNIGDAA